MSKSKSKSTHTDKAYLKRVVEGGTTTEDKLFSLLNGIEIVLYRIGEYQSDPELKENFGRMYKEAKRLRKPDMKPVPKRTGDYRCDLTDLREWAVNVQQALTRKNYGESTKKNDAYIKKGKTNWEFGFSNRIFADTSKQRIHTTQIIAGSWTTRKRGN